MKQRIDIGSLSIETFVLREKENSMRKKIFRGIPDWYEDLCCYLGHATIASCLIVAIGTILTFVWPKIKNKNEKTDEIDLGNPNDPDRYKEVK